MDIKRINGVISAYSTGRSGKIKKTETAAEPRNTDRVEFGFETALSAAKKGIAAEVRSDAPESEIAAAKAAAEQGIAAGSLADYILFG